MNDWEKMAAITNPVCMAGKDECEKFRSNPYRCCDKKYCAMAAGYARTQGVELMPTGNPDLPFMGESGCVVQAHLRPICTIHVCTISYAGKSHINHDPQQTQEYFDLRKQLGI